MGFLDGFMFAAGKAAFTLVCIACMFLLAFAALVWEAMYKRRGRK